MQTLNFLAVGLVSAAAAYWVAVTQSDELHLSKENLAGQYDAAVDSSSFNVAALEKNNAVASLEAKFDSVLLELQQIQHRVSQMDLVLEEFGHSAASENRVAEQATLVGEDKAYQEEILRQAMLEKLYLQREEVRVEYESQARDIAWAETTESTAFDSVNRENMLSGSDITEMDCRSTVCLLKAVHEDSDSAERFRMIFPGTISQHASRINWDNNGLNTVAYIQK